MMLAIFKNNKVLAIIGITALYILLILSFLKIGEAEEKQLKPAPTITSLPIYSPTPTGEPITSFTLIRLVNEWRVENNLPAYKDSSFACEVAKKRLPEVKLNWSHNGFYTHMRNEDYCKDCYLGENLARGYSSNNEVLESWLASPSHKANLVKNYPYSCIITDGVYVVQIFSYF